MFIFSQELSLAQEEAIAALKLETRNDLLRMQAQFDEKESAILNTVKQKDGVIRELQKQIDGRTQHIPPTDTQQQPHTEPSDTTP